MNKLIVSMPMEFNRKLFAQDCRTMMAFAGVTQYEVDALVGSQVIASVLSEAKADYMPTLRNFVALCNVLDLDPRRYFTLQLPDKD